MFAVASHNRGLDVLIPDASIAKSRGISGLCSMENLTKILEEMGTGSEAAKSRFLDLVYDELRTMAAFCLRSEASGQTLQATALVHEAWLRLLDAQGTLESSWQNRRHFFGAASEAMRRILIERARFKKRQKRGGPDAKREPLFESQHTVTPLEDEVLDLHAALTEFEAIDEVKAQIVKLKFFVGLTNREISEITQLSMATVERYWVYARAWLHRKMAEKSTT